MALAEESEDGQEKTEDPTQRKLDKAAEDGKVLSSKEMFVFTSLAMGVLMVMAMSNFGGSYLISWSTLFQIEPGTQLDHHILKNLYFILFFFIELTLVFGVPVLLVTVVTQGAVGGFIFAMGSMAFKGSKISPIAGFKRMFSVKSLVELGKSILKVVSLFGVGYIAIVSYMPKLMRLPDGSLASGLGTLRDTIPALIGFLLIALLIIAAIDYFWQRHTFNEEMKMSKQELKDEYKQMEGSPEVKAKIRRKQMEASQRSSEQRAAIEDVPKATAIITNPTHFAIALQYEVGQPGAPTILAMGKGKIAEQIIEKGGDANVTVFRSPLLARALYYTGDIGGEISERLYSAVAVVLAYIYRIEKGEDLLSPEFELPDDLQFDEYGNLMKDAENG